MLAQAFQTLHHLTDGKMILGIGAGEIKDGVPYDVEFDWLVSKFEEFIELMSLARTGHLTMTVNSGNLKTRCSVSRRSKLMEHPPTLQSGLERTAHGCWR